MSHGKIRVETTPDGVLVVTLDDPGTRNAAGAQMQAELLAELDRMQNDPALRVLVITGAGNTFCSGANMRDMARALDEGEWGAPPDPAAPRNAWAELDPVYYDREVPPAWAGPDIVRKLHNLRKPSFAAVNGHALGFGCGVALSCDFRSAARSARFSETFIRRGLVPADGSAWQLPKLVGMANALWMHYSGDAITGEEAYRIGLANWLFDDEALLDGTLELATKLARGPVFAMGIAKLLVHEAYQEDLAKHLRLSARAQELTKRTPEHREGLRAFIEKREPRFVD
jgi:2-(1,2-epoxy-1,2-dihydrophenyl)acetyl-CoA isomerase